MKIYVASSWRNEWQPWAVAQLRFHGHDVYDFRHPANGGFGWREITEKPVPQWTFDDYREVLDNDRAAEAFASDMGGLIEADVCLLVLPSGRSAHVEAGWANGNGKPTAVWFPP